MSFVPPPLIPRPVRCEPRPGQFALQGAHIVAAPGAADVAGIAARMISDRGVQVPVPAAPDGSRDTAPDGSRPIRLLLDDAAGPAGSTSAERYSLVVAADHVEIRAAQAAGLVRGTATLAQLIPVGGDHIGAIEIHDAPRYRWRGLSVDIARRMYSAETICLVIDQLAAYKFNVLHVHLTDDQGWRIEIPSRPELTKLSSGSECGGGPGGFLTALDFEDIQEYAAARHIVVVPEFDMPGHTNAATHAFGNLRPDGVATEVYEGYEVGFSTLTFDLAETEPFMRDVFGDLAAMTTGPYLHIGGDEAHSTEKTEFAKFIELAERIAIEHGKVPVAWNEAATVPLRPGTIVQYWDTNHTDPATLRAAAASGARILLSPGKYVYLDMKYNADYPLGQDWAGYIEVRDAYEWDPDALVPGLPAEAIEGVEAAVWTEFIRDRTELFRMLLPRLAAVAEVAWSPQEGKDWESFRTRMAAQARFWEANDAAYEKSPQIDWT